MPLLERLPLTDATRQWAVWGTTARIVVTDPSAADAAQELVAGLLGEIDLACSRFRSDSELAGVQFRLEQLPGRAVLVSPLLGDLIDAALYAAERTDGAVDPTLADDLAALGYDRDYAELTLRTASRAIPVRLSHRVKHRWQDVHLDGLMLRMPAGTRLDLGAIAKAFAADQAALAVAETFDCGALVSLGGDLATAGPPPETVVGDGGRVGAGWQVLVQDGVGEPASRIRLDTGALATSSTISRTWRVGTRALHHILDPSSGLPADPVWRTVSVAGSSCADSNALSTAAIVLGWDAVPMLRAEKVPARLVSRAGQIVTLGGWP